MSITIPPSTKLREQIRERTTEVRALRALLRLAEAAEAVEAARERQRAARPPAREERGGPDHAA